jgi:hypothetical protein
MRILTASERVVLASELIADAADMQRRILGYVYERKHLRASRYHDPVAIARGEMLLLAADNLAMRLPAMKQRLTDSGK